MLVGVGGIFSLKSPTSTQRVDLAVQAIELIHQLRTFRTPVLYECMLQKALRLFHHRAPTTLTLYRQRLDANDLQLNRAICIHVCTMT